MDIADLLPELLVDAPECPDATARAAILGAAIELCNDSLVWNEIQDPIALIDEIPTYDIDTPSQAEVVAVMGAWLPSGPLLPKTLSEIVQMYPNWQAASSPSPEYYNNVPGNSTIRVFPIPVNAQRAPMTMRVAYAPIRTADELPDALVRAHQELLMRGARARLMLQPRKPWSDARLGAFNAELFAAGKVDERIKVTHDGTPGSMTVKAREFGF